MSEFFCRTIAYRRRDECDDSLSLSAVGALCLALQLSWEDAYELLVRQAVLLGVLPHHQTCGINAVRAAGYSPLRLKEPLKDFEALHHYLTARYPGIPSAIIVTRTKYGTLPQFHAVRPLVGADGFTRFTVLDRRERTDCRIAEVWLPAAQAGLKPSKPLKGSCRPCYPIPQHDTFRYFQPNPQGNATGDCVIRAYAAVFQLAWEEALRQCAEACEYTTAVLHSGLCYRYLASRQGLTAHPAPKRYGRSLTADEFCRLLNLRYHDGQRFFVDLGSNHAAAIIPVTDGDGSSHYVVADCWDSTKRKVGVYWEYQPPKPKLFSPAYSVAPAADPDAVALTEGTAVTHPAFGPGRVTAVSGEGRSRRVTLRFDGGQEATLGDAWVRAHCQCG